MNFIRLLEKLCVNSQIFVSLMGTFLAMFFMKAQNFIGFPILFFFTYLCGYLYTKYQHHPYYKKVIIFNSIIGILCTTHLIINTNYTIFVRWVSIILLGILYNSFFLNIYIRKIPLFKIFYVGLVWGLMNSGFITEQWNIPIFFINLLYISALVLPFDIKDINNDTVTTFPQLIGIQNTKILAFLMIIASVMISYIYLEHFYFVCLGISSVVSFGFIFFSTLSKPNYYYTLGVESCCGLPFLIGFILKNLQ